MTERFCMSLVVWTLAVLWPLFPHSGGEGRGADEWPPHWRLLPCVWRCAALQVSAPLPLWGVCCSTENFLETKHETETEKFLWLSLLSNPPHQGKKHAQKLKVYLRTRGSERRSQEAAGASKVRSDVGTSQFHVSIPTWNYLQLLCLS